ncbi:MAG: ABC transporter substrate-binding protein [Bacteroidota bacterium]
MKLQSRFLLLALSACCFLLTNCDRDKPIEEEEAPTVEYKRNVNEVIAAYPSEADNLNPLLSTSNTARIVHTYLFQTLEVVNPKTLTLTPLLAKARPQVEEIKEGEEVTGVAYTFEIREEAAWPNGSPVTAKDVEFSMKAMYNPRVPAGAFRNNASAIQDLVLYEDDPRKLSVIMQGKYIRNEEIAGNGFYIMPAYHYDPQNLLADISIQDLIDPDKAEQLANSNPKLQQFADEFIQPKYAREIGGVVGSGPYQLKEFTTGQRLVLERKTDWWGEKIETDNPLFENNVEEIIYQPIRDATAKTAAIRSEQIDVLSNVAPQIYEELKDDEAVSQAYDFFAAPQYVSGFWLINTKNPKLADKRVRRALAHVVDVDAIIENVLQMSLNRISNIVLPSMPGYDSSLSLIEFDVEKAKSLLAEAGWEDTNNNGTVDKEIDGKLTEMNLEILTVNSRATQQEAALLVKEDAIKAGINLEILNQEPNVQRENFKSRNFELATNATLEPAPWAYDPNQMWHTESDTPDGFNRVGFGNAATDALIEEIRTTLDEEKRLELYKEFQRIVYDEQPMIFLYEVPNFLVIHKRFNAEAFNYNPNYLPGTFDMAQQ